MLVGSGHASADIELEVCFSCQLRDGEGSLIDFRESHERRHGQVYTAYRMRLYSFGPALFTLEQFTVSWFGVRRAYSFTKKREGKREGAKLGESRAQGMRKCILRLEPALFTIENSLSSWFGVRSYCV